jgi:hypothetical protein
MAIVETLIKIKEYSAHSYIPSEKRFIGLRNTDAYRLISADVFADMDQSRKQLGDDKIRFMQDAYKWKDDELMGVANREMVKGLDPIDKGCIWTVFDTYARQGSSMYFQIQNTKEYKNKPPALPDEESLKTVKNKYIDVFHQDPVSRKVYLRCEYYADQNGLLKNVPVQKLSDSRQPEGSGSDHFGIAANERNWILLTAKKLRACRLEEIRRRLETNGSCDRVMEIPALGVSSGSGGNSIFDKLKQIQELKKKGDPIPENLYKGVHAIENLIMDSDGAPRCVTVILTDYMAQMKELRTKFDDCSGKVDSFIGTKTGNSDQNLMYLVCSTSSVREKWGCISTTNRKRLQNSFSTFKNISAQLGRVTELLARWITRPQFSEALYDDLFECYDNQYAGGFEALCDAYLKMVKGLADSEGSEEALLEYCEEALHAYEAALVKKKDPKGKSLDIQDVLTEFWNPKNPGKSIDPAFKLLELYKNSVKTPNFLVEVAYPQAKTARKVALGVLTYLSKPIVHANGKRFRDKLPDHIAAWMSMLNKDQQVVVDFFDPQEVSYWGRRKPVQVVVISASTRNKSSAAEIVGGAKVDALKKAMAAIDTVLIAKKISEDGLNLENSLALFKSALDFSKEWKLLEESAGKGAITGSTVGGHQTDVIKLPLKTLTGVIDILLGAIKFYKLAEKGDMDAAVVRGIGKMTIAAVGIFVTQPEVVLFLVFAGIAIDIIGDLITEDDFMRWIEFGTYGKKSMQLSGDSWKYFSKEYIAKDNELENETISRWFKSSTQIETYYRLLYSFEICDSIAFYYDMGKKFKQYEFIELRLKTRLLVTDSRYTIEIIEYRDGKAVRTLSSVDLTDRNSCLEEQASKSGNTIATFLYDRKAVVDQYFEENARINKKEQECRYIMAVPPLATYPKPERYDDTLLGIYEGFPELRVKISLRLGGMSGEALLTREKRVEYRMLTISMV